MKKKRILSLVLALALAVGLTACGSGQIDKPATSPDPAASGDPASSAPSQIVVGLSMTYTSLDPAGSYEAEAEMVLHAVYPTLVRNNPQDESEVLPYLATDWTVSSDGLSYVFNIQQGVKFTTGKDLTAADVAYCLTRAKEIKGNPSFLLDTVDTVEATGDYEVTMKLNTVNPALLSILTRASFGIYDSEVAAANGGSCDANDTFQTYVNANPSIGCGPYQIVSYTSGSQVILEKNPTYFGEPGKVDKFIVKNISDASAQQMEIEAGDIDFALDLTADQTAVLADNANLQMITSKSFNLFFLMLNASEEYGKELADPTVRDALRYAIDYEGLCALAGNGAFTPAGIIPAGFLGYAGESTLTRDVEKAKSLLAEAGYPNGFTFSCGVIPDMAPDGVSFMMCAEKIQSDLAEVGVTMQIDSQEVSVYLEQYRNGTQQAVVSQWGPDYYDANNQLSFLPGNTVGLRAGWPTEMAPELAALGDQAALELDDTVRAQLFAQIQEQMVEASAPYIIFLQAGRTWAVNSRIQNIVPSSAYMLDFATLEVAG